MLPNTPLHVAIQAIGVEHRKRNNIATDILEITFIILLLILENAIIAIIL